MHACAGAVSPVRLADRSGVGRFRLLVVVSLGLGWSLAAPPPLASEPAGQPPVCSAEWIAEARAVAASSRATLMSLGAAGPMAPPRAAVASMAAPGVAMAAPASVPPPNDTYFLSYQTYSLKTIGALDAWEVSYGGDDVTVAIISSGVDYRHPDLASKIWRNPGEIAGNGIDDDGNGYVDDVNGWDFHQRRGDPMDFDVGLRGTMMAGIVAAETNNREGIAGVSWGARIMPLKVLFEYRFPDGQRVAAGEDEDIIEAVCYAVNNGAQVILLNPILRDPWQAAETVDRLRQAIAFAHQAGAVVVAPAGDCGGDPWADGRRWCPDPDLHGSDGQNPVIYPANFPYVIGVQSFGPNTQLRPEASWGPWVDISAPGEEFMTTGLEGKYRPVRFWEPGLGGWRAVSDFAAAHVAGVVAVMRSIDPQLSPLRTLEYLCVNARHPAGVAFDQDVGGWRRNDRLGCGALDFERAVERMPWRVHGVVPAAVTVLTDGQSPRIRTVFQNRYLNRGKWGLIEEAEWLASEDSPQAPGRPSRVQLVTDLEGLRRVHGSRLVNSTFTQTLWACPVGSVNEADRQHCFARTEPDARCPCQRVPYQLRVVERVERLFLPAVGPGRGN